LSTTFNRQRDTDTVVQLLSEEIAGLTTQCSCAGARLWRTIA